MINVINHLNNMEIHIMNITVLGIDLAKNSMQLHGIDKSGKTILKKSISRNKLPDFIANLKPCLIGMEACGGAVNNYLKEPLVTT